MTRNHRPRWLPAALTAVLALALAACSTANYPNSIFTHHTDFNRDIDVLWRRLFFFSGIVFVGVEAALLYIVFRYRRREGGPEPKHTHGHTALEITWTAIPALILVFIAIPTVRTIFATQAKAPAGALQVEVIGHQWWWEFRYPQYGVTTANELYLPAGRTANFKLNTADVIHSFWIPELAGTRDLVSNHTNWLWFTPDSTLGENAWNGFCKEYCGASHANMRFRVYTVSPDKFERWAAHQKLPAVFGVNPATLPGAAAPAAGTVTAAGVQPEQGAKPTVTMAGVIGGAPAAAGQGAQGAQGGVAAAAADSGYVFPADKLPPHVIPSTPIPDGVSFPANLEGDATRGMQVYSRSACIGCHTISGNPSSIGIIGPNLTHLATRHTIAAGLYPNDTRHLALWIKNARVLKPGSLMPTLGKDQIDPTTRQKALTGTLSDQDIADIVAYLQALK